MRVKGQVEPMVNFGVRLRPATNERVEKLAKIKRRTKTQLIRIIIEDYVKQYEDDELFEKDVKTINYSQKTGLAKTIRKNTQEITTYS